MARLNPAAKEEAHRRAGGRCERCRKPYDRGNGEAHVHHLTYERRGHELPADLIVLCLACHGAEHPHHDFVDFRTQRSRASRRKKKRQKRRPMHDANADKYLARVRALRTL